MVGYRIKLCYTRPNKMRKHTKKSLTNKLDKECSRIVRSRGFCARCNMVDYEKFQCAHIFSRTYRSVRWFSDNLLCLCAGCHFWAHRNPVLFVEWVRAHLGEEKYLSLKIMAIALKKWTLCEMEELLVVLKEL